MIVVSTLSQLRAPNAYARMHGYCRLMEILNLCSTLTDICLMGRLLGVEIFVGTSPAQNLVHYPQKPHSFNENDL